MKVKFILLACLTLPSMNSFAYSLIYQGDYCGFAGIAANPKIAPQKEFAMILEHAALPNFQAIIQAIAAVAITPEKELNDQACPIYNYSRALLRYYEANKEKIDQDKPYITHLFAHIQEKLENKEPVDSI